MNDQVVYAISVGVITSILFALFYAVNLFRYKISSKAFDDIFWYTLATIVLLTSIFLSNVAFIGSKYPILDHQGWLTDRDYLPYTKSAVWLSILLYVRAFVGDRYPRLWIYCSLISLLASIVAYILFT